MTAQFYTSVSSAYAHSWAISVKKHVKAVHIGVRFNALALWWRGCTVCAFAIHL